ncbi:M56 family metallopeptidase [Flavobacterium sp. SUN046]|uniref:M56 family metallopeptidase n=1 Tax=Flavobacterium sp. SUN046 TaxID=3002440 RepID=UPI002DB94AD3|nr:M56 family metallopeptidase [Flavobacterium sp. SUN046]MEC4048457.1 M56 family metallopeptidase [Flavobacterium sp. SUN046]
METIFLYLIKSSALIAVFFLTYYLLLKKETFFKTNRWFLLSGLVISVSLPLYIIKKVVWVEKPKLSVEDLLAMANPAKNAPLVESSINWFDLLFIGYGLVVTSLSIKILINLVSLFQLLYKKQMERKEDFTLINVNEPIAPFSFFKYIVYNPSLYSEHELQSILLHEKVHSKQRHSIDVLIAQLFCVLFWFNPFIWWYKKAIVQNLEYIADSEAIQLIEDKKAYQRVLLKVVSHQNCLPITNNFYQSLIKKRIVMLNTNPSNRRNSWKYTMIVPALIAFIFLFQIKTVAQEKRDNGTVTVEKALAIGFVTDKNATDEEMKNDTQTLKEQGIDYKFSNVKRNDQGEIIAIKIKYKTKDGQSGAVAYSSNEPINPIYFNTREGQVGFSTTKPKLMNGNQNVTIYTTGDTNESEDQSAAIELTEALVPEPPAPPTPPNVSNRTDKRIIIKKIEKSGDKPIIIVDGVRFEDGNVDDIDAETIDKVEVFKDNETTKAYGKEGKNGVIIITTKNIYGDSETNVSKKVEIIKSDAMRQAKLEMEKAHIEMEKARREMELSKPEMERAQRELEASRPEMEKARAEMIQARKEMLKAKAEMEAAKKEFQKAKEALKK